MSVTLKSRIPEIQAELPVKVGEAIHSGTERLATTVRDRTPVGHPEEPDLHPGELRDSVQVTDEKYGYTSNASAGVSMQFYWFFIEYGTSRMPARPFVRPSVEQEAPALIAEVRAALVDL